MLKVIEYDWRGGEAMDKIHVYVTQFMCIMEWMDE